MAGLRHRRNYRAWRTGRGKLVVGDEIEVGGVPTPDMESVIKALMEAPQMVNLRFADALPLLSCATKCGSHDHRQVAIRDGHTAEHENAVLWAA